MHHKLILLHGFPHDKFLWDPNRQGLADVADVYAPDLWGFGANVPERRMTTMDDMAEDLHRSIAARKMDRLVLCGLSMGGYVAMAFLERWPELVHGLILCNTRSTADSEEAKAAREVTANDALDKGMAVIARGMLPKVLCRKTRHERPDIVERMETLMARQHPTGVAAASRGLALRPDRTATLRSYTRRALVITGAEDELMPLPTSQAMIEALANAELVVLPDAGHLSNVEQPHLFNAAVMGYLSSL